MRLLILVEDSRDNALGRAYVLWLLAEHLRWTAAIVASRGSEIWQPLAHTRFADACVTISDEESPTLLDMARSSDLIVAVKPLPNSFGRGRALSRRSLRPLLLDVDDPDLESRMAFGRPGKAIAKAVLKPNVYWGSLRLRRAARGYPVLVSNPSLQSYYGGRIVPHARADGGAGEFHKSSTPTVAFVGTNRPHKGLGLLRDAAAHVGLPLVITDDPPTDVRTNERWVGRTTMQEGLDLVRRSDLVVLPSMPTDAYSWAQLPAKLIDGMLSARPVIASDLPPLSWALGPGAPTFPPGDRESLIARLETYRSPTLRAETGLAARDRALKLFTIESVAPEFESACLDAVHQTQPGL